MSAEDLMAKLTQKGGTLPTDGKPIEEEEEQQDDKSVFGGRRRRRNSKGRKGNSWLDHVKYTMKDKKNKGKSFKQILKIAKKTYKRSQSQSQSGGKRRKGKSQKNYQNGGSGGKVAGVGASASPYV